MLGVLVSYAISNSLSIGVFDVLLEMKGLPYLPSLKSVEAYNMQAKHIMTKNFMYLTQNSTFADIFIFLQQVGARPWAVPVVLNHQSKLIKFSVQA